MRAAIKVMADLLFSVVIIKGLQQNSTLNNMRYKYTESKTMKKYSIQKEKWGGIPISEKQTFKSKIYYKRQRRT